MNYLSEILQFNDRLLMNKLSTGQIALWYGLMYINNKCGWAEWFTAANHVLENLTGLTRQAIVKDRNSLAQKGFLEFRTNGTKATSYKLLTMSNSLQGSFQGSFQDSLQDGLQGSFQDSLPLNKQKQKLKLKQNEKESVKRKIFTPPTLEEVKSYIAEKGYSVDAERFVSYYGSINWYVGKKKMADWRQAVTGWESRDKGEQKKNKFTDFEHRGDYDIDEFEKREIMRRMEG